MLCVISPSIALAQFSSGSTGADGPLNVTSNLTLDLPPTGIFNFTTITVASGSTLRFNRNPLNTPVYLLATGDVVIIGTIDVSGKVSTFGKGGEGGPGGFDGGSPANGQETSPGDGLGPGGGKGSVNNPGGGAYSSINCPSGGSGQAYGNTLIVPLIGGSGGGGTTRSDGLGGGGGGGGAILIASNTRISIGSSGKISSFGGDGIGSVGSGGAVRLVANQIDGSGQVVAMAGSCTAGFGRVRVDATNRFALFLNYGVSSIGGTPHTIGQFMHVFPTNTSRLDIIEAAGTAISEGTPIPVPVQLPVGSPTNQVVKIQARDFTGIVPITVAVTPDAGPSTRYDTQIDMAGGNVASTDVTVNIPVGTTSRIYAWTR